MKKKLFSAILLLGLFTQANAHAGLSDFFRSSNFLRSAKKVFLSLPFGSGLRTGTGYFSNGNGMSTSDYQRLGMRYVQGGGYPNYSSGIRHRVSGSCIGSDSYGMSRSDYVRIGRRLYNGGYYNR